jgi:hypothetical protein
MSYGTGEQGQQGGQFVYDVWDPTLGTDSAAHLVLPNTTGTDVFCSGQSVISARGEVLITGGDLTINGQRNFSNQQTTVFHPQTNTVTAAEPMLYARWYPSVVSLPDGFSAAVRILAPPPRLPKSIGRVRGIASANAVLAFRTRAQHRPKLHSTDPRRRFASCEG